MTTSDSCHWDQDGARSPGTAHSEPHGRHTSVNAQFHHGLLVIEVDYSAKAAISSIRREQKLRDREIDVAYRENHVIEHPFSGPQTRCESALTTLIDPGTKRIR